MKNSPKKLIRASGSASSAPRTRPRKPLTISRIQFALLRPILRPGEGADQRAAAAILEFESMLVAAGWSREQAKAESRRLGMPRVIETVAADAAQLERT